MNQLATSLLLGAALSVGSTASAAPAEIEPASYSASGISGFYPDSGSELTDGVIADRHFAFDNSNREANSGWRDIDPSVSFSFASPASFGSLIVWVDDFSGRAGVTAPIGLSAVVNGVTYSNFTIGAPLDAGFAYDDPSWGDGAGTPFILNLAGATGGTVDLTVARGGEWTFISEVQFFAPTVPEPATWAMMIGGFALAGTAARRRMHGTAAQA